ncbi:MAG TPA: glycosyltransferase [Polyangiaceae bacterium]|nr:glycosyltransferase [Polyangiaceae bacterium]
MAPDARARSGKPIPVVHLITGLGVGGAETMLHKLLANIDRERFPSSVVSMIEPGPMAPKIAALGVHVESLGLSRGVPDPRAVRSLVRLLRHERPAILQAWMYHADLLGLAAARIARVPKIAWNIRCSDLDMKNSGRLLSAVFSAHGLAARFADAIIVNSGAGLRFHQESGHQARRWEMIPNGFDLDRFRPDESRRATVRAELGLSSGDIAIGMVARFDRYKDHDTFFAAAGRLRAERPNAVFVLAGRGLSLDNAAVVNQLEQRGLMASTRLLGELADTSELLPGLDVFTLCSHSEGFPNALGEAMSSALPCVATDVGDCALVLGDTGRIVPLRDPAAVAEAWQALIDAGPRERARMGRRARSRVETRFSLASVVAAYEALYVDLAGN